MPQGFAFPVNEELWIPLYSEFPVRPRNDPRNINPAVLGAAQARGHASTRPTPSSPASPSASRRPTPTPTRRSTPPRSSRSSRPSRPLPLRGTLLTMLAFCVGVLLIACVNVMNMQFARATLRAKELAVRSSLGATRARLIRQMLTESLLVAGIGAVAGDRPRLPRRGLAVRDLPQPRQPAALVDHLRHRRPRAGLHRGRDPGRRDRLRAAARLDVVARQRGRGLEGRRARQHQPPRRPPDPRAGRVPDRGDLHPAHRVAAAGALDPQPADDRLRLRHRRHHVRPHGPDGRRLSVAGGPPRSSSTASLASCAAHPEFDAVALTSRFRMVFSGSGPIEIEGKEYKEKSDRPNANFEQVTGGFFEVTGQRILEGRTFTEDDLDTKLPVAVVNAAFAKKHFGTESPIGRRFRTVDGNTRAAGSLAHHRRASSARSACSALQHPERGRLRLLRAVLLQPPGPALAEPFVSQFATVIVKPRGGQRPTRWPPPCAAGREGGREPAPLLRRHPEEEPRRLRGPEPHRRHHVLDLRSGGRRPGRGRHLRGDVVRGEPADAGVRGAHGPGRESADASWAWSCARARPRSCSAW